MATNTRRMRLGTCVTNPATRDLTVTASLFATLNLISGGRMELGIGRGDSSRACWEEAVSWSQLEAAVKEFRDLTSGKEVEHDGQPTRLTWAKTAAGLDRWIRAQSPAHGRARGGRHHSAICRSSVDRLVHGICEGRRASRGRERANRSHGRSARLGFRRS